MQNFIVAALFSLGLMVVAAVTPASARDLLGRPTPAETLFNSYAQQAQETRIRGGG